MQKQISIEEAYTYPLALLMGFLVLSEEVSVISVHSPGMMQGLGLNGHIVKERLWYHGIRARMFQDGAQKFHSKKE